MKETLSVVALLPLKAHSERVTGKNFRMFAGRPLFSWILETLLSLDRVDLVVINTDARDLLKANGLVESSRVLIRDRKPDLCGDFVSMNKILNDDVMHVSAESYIMTHTTNPLLGSETISRALETYEKHNETHDYDSLFSVTKHQTRFYKSDGSAINHDPKVLLRTQDLEPWYEENSNLYIFSKDSFLQTNARIGLRPILFETPKLESFDIDDRDGWELAEAYARSRASANLVKG